VILFKFWVDEPEGRIERSVMELHPDPSTILEIYDKLKKVRNFYTQAGHEPYSNEDILLDLLNNYQWYWLIDDVGIFHGAPLSPDSGHVHMTFWDRRLRGREGLVKEALRQAMDKHGWLIAWTATIPEAKTAEAFVRRLGFTEFASSETYTSFWITRQAL
jgi:hypothetical protein